MSIISKNILCMSQDPTNSVVMVAWHVLQEVFPLMVTFEKKDKIGGSVSDTEK